MGIAHLGVCTIVHINSFVVYIMMPIVSILVSCPNLSVGLYFLHHFICVCGCFFFSVFGIENRYSYSVKCLVFFFALFLLACDRGNRFPWGEQGDHKHPVQSVILDSTRMIPDSMFLNFTITQRPTVTYSLNRDDRDIWVRKGKIQARSSAQEPR